LPTTTLAAIANFISTTTSLSGFCGGLLSTAGLAVEFCRPQSALPECDLYRNFVNATYNSAQIELNQAVPAAGRTSAASCMPRHCDSLRRFPPRTELTIARSAAIIWISVV